MELLDEFTTISYESESDFFFFFLSRKDSDIIMDGLFSQFYLMGSQQENLQISVKRTTLRAISTVLLSHFVQLII